MFEYDGRIGQLRGLLDQQVPAARAVLARIVRRLEEYRIERPPETHLGVDVDQAAPAAPPHVNAATPADAAPQKSVSLLEENARNETV
jgi:hypothetical protein